MNYIPSWVVDVLMSKKFRCHECEKVFTHKQVKAIGIRESLKNTDKEIFYIELKCSKCNQITFFEMQEMNLIELSEEVLLEIEGDIDESDENNADDYSDSEVFIENSSKPVVKNSKITLKELRDSIKILKSKDLYHEKFLEMMGMNPEDITEYEGNK